tara:strand:- start:43 stop:162 length:120 start_codon:yes stop_codon:yes gene_type:complete
MDFAEGVRIESTNRISVPTALKMNLKKYFTQITIKVISD